MSHMSPTEYNIKEDSSHRIFKIAATQMACSNSIEANIQKAVKLVRDAAKSGAKVILLQELLKTEMAVRFKKGLITLLKVLLTPVQILVNPNKFA